LDGKLFIDGVEVIGMEWSPNIDRNTIMFTLASNPYGDDIAEPYVIIQYVATPTLIKGTIDVM
jgi:hypothetical protein